MFSTLTMNSINTSTYNEHENLLSVSTNFDEKQFDKNYKFGVDGNLGYASLINTSFLDTEIDEKQNTKPDKLEQICSTIASNKAKVQSKKNEMQGYNCQTNPNNKVETKDIVNKKENKKVNHNNSMIVKKEIKQNVPKKIEGRSTKVVQQTPKKEEPVSLPQNTSTDVPKTENPNTKIVNGVAYTIKKTISGGNATAYSSDAGGSITSTGCKVFTSNECCCVAVDPKQIPYYSDLLIEFNDGRIIKGKALDTGSALRKHYKGVVVDIYMNTERECNQFGRQPVKVHIV